MFPKIWELGMMEGKGSSMFQWIKKLKTSSRKTKVFIFTGVVYLLATVITTIYAFARLDYIHSIRKTDTQQSLTK